MPAHCRFRCIALPHEPFAALFGLDETQLRRHHARRLVVDASPGFPCRLTLADAEIGETVLLLPYAHLTGDTPYRASGPVYVCEHAVAVEPEVGTVPPALRSRLLSLRAYDRDGLMIAADVIEGAALEGAIERTFENADVACIHVHFARPGCYAARIERA